MPDKREPLLLLDNSTMYVIGAGDYHSTNLSFEEAKAIIDMYSTEDILRCFTDRATEQVLHDFVGIEPRNFAYKPIRKMRVGQDSIAVKLHITPSETQPRTASPPRRSRTCTSTASTTPAPAEERNEGASRLGGPFSASKFLFHIISVFREGEDLHIILHGDDLLGDDIFRQAQGKVLGFLFTGKAPFITPHGHGDANVFLLEGKAELNTLVRIVERCGMRVRIIGCVICENVIAYRLFPTESVDIHSLQGVIGLWEKGGQILCL